MAFPKFDYFRPMGMKQEPAAPWSGYYKSEDMHFEVEDISIYEFIRRCGEDYQDSIAIDYFGVNVSYPEFFRKIEQAARSFLEMGVEPGDVVTILSANVPEALYAFYGINRIGAVANLLHPLLSENEIREALNRYQSVMLVALDICYPRIRNIISDTAVKSTVIISATDPEFSVAKGLAYCGRIDEDLKEFKEDLDKLVRSNTIEEIVSKHITSLYRSAVDVLVDPIVSRVAPPIFEKWRSGEIARLSDTDVLLQQDIGAFLGEEETRELLAGPITSWLRPVIEELEEHTVPICIRHRIPYTALSLRSYLSVSDIDIKVDAKEMFAIKEMTLLIDSIVTALLAILMSTFSFLPFFADPSGIMIGIIASVVLLFLGKDKMQEKMLTADIPKPVRRLVPKSAFNSRMDNISSSVKEAFYESLEQGKNEEIKARMVEEISSQIQHTLVKMAEVVEIPLG